MRIGNRFQKTKLVCCMVIGLFWQPQVHAAENYHNLSLQQAIDIALNNNIEKKVSLEAAVIAESQYQEALAARMPNISFQASMTRMDDDPSFTYPASNISIAGISAPLNAALGGLAQAHLLPPGLSLPSDILVPQQKIKLMNRDTAIATVELMYPLYTGGKISSIIHQANLAKSIAKEEYQRSTLQVVRDVKRYYYAVTLTRGLGRLAEDTVATLQATRDLTKSMYEAGTGTVNKLDYLKTEMAVSFAQSLANDFSSRELSATAALLYAMGLPLDTEINIAENDFSVNAQQQGLTALIRQAHQFNPQLGMMKLAVQIADEKVNEAKSAYFPQIALTANLRHIENAYDGGLMNSTNKDSWTIGVVMKMPIFDFGRTSNNLNTSKLQAGAMREKQQLVEQGLAAQLKNLFINLEASNKQKEISKNAVGVSGQHERLTEQAYQIGASKPEDMIQASLMNAVLQGNYLRAKHDTAYNLAEIEYFIGNEIK